MEAETIAHYRILEKLGAGGMGEVYLVEDLKLGRKVALKLLNDELTTNRDRLHRFEQEACAASALNHPNILTIHEVGTDNDRHFIATEFIDGLTLRQKMRATTIEVNEILDIAIQIASALEEAHAAGIIHRDIKPDNVMVRRNGFVKVLDFGLAKLTETVPDKTSSDADASTRMMVQTDAGVVMGTSHYMSPEQARGKQVDARSDLWSLGVVMYELVTSRQPFQGDTSTDVIVAITQKEPPPIARFAENVPAELDWIINKALRKDREERYQTAKELLTDLRRLKQRLEFEAELERSVAPDTLIRSGPVTDQSPVGVVSSRMPATQATKEATVSHPVSSAEYVVSEIKRHKVGAAVVAMLFVLGIAGLVFFYFGRAKALTDKDTVLLADFVNMTGDPVFDGTLKQALAVQLGQSPFLNIYPDERVRQTLRFMGRSPDDRITRDVGREICERQGIKALLLGSISSLGSHYVMTLEALNAHTGDTIARDQVEAESKEQVLSSLSKSASKLREKLGESLSSIKKFDVPADQATTSSLEALKAYASGNEERAKGNQPESVPYYKRAIELDPNFAMAYARLAVFYGNSFELDMAQQYAQKAYDLRDRVSEHERFYISEKYHNYITGDIYSAIEVLRAWARTYPNDYIPHNNLVNNYSFIGLYDDALKEALEAVRLDPRNTTARGNLVDAFIKLERYDEAKQAFDELQSRNPDSGAVHFYNYQLAFLRNDRPAMQREVEWAKGKPIEPDVLGGESAAAAFNGKLKQSEELMQRSLDLFKAQDRKENASQVLINFGSIQAVFGDCKKASANASAGLTLARGRIGLGSAALLYAFCEDSGRSQAVLDEMIRLYPKDTANISILAPMVRAEIERNRGNPARAVQLLDAVKRFDLSVIAGYWNNYIRGLAYLQQRSGGEAAVEFQKILDHRGVDMLSSLYPLAHLGLARAAALSGDTAKSKQKYQDFFALWKDADPDVPILIEARKEYAALK